MTSGVIYIIPFQSYSVAGRMDALKTRILSDLDES